MQPQFLPGPIQVAAGAAGHARRNGPVCAAATQIAAVDGHAFHSVNTLLAYMQWEQGKPMTLDRAAQRRHGRDYGHAGQARYAIHAGLLPQLRSHHATSLCHSLRHGCKSLAFFKNNSLLVGEVLDRLFTHRLSVSQLMGPVGIAQVAGEAAETKGWMSEIRTGQR